MGLLDKLWDDTVAGPQPESGLGRLRKHPSFGGSRPAPESPTIEEARVSRAITIIKTSNFRNLAVDPNSGPASPVGSGAPESPLSCREPSQGETSILLREPKPRFGVEMELWLVRSISYG